MTDKENKRNEWRQKVWPKHLLPDENREVYTCPDLSISIKEENRKMVVYEIKKKDKTFNA